MPKPDLYIRRDVRLAPYTTWGVGGLARILLAPRNLDELADAVRLANASAGSFHTLGGGSNVLIADGVIETPVILTTEVSGVSAVFSGGEVYLSCMAGTSLKSVLSLSVRNGWSGLEFAAGIPGTVGGAVACNSGTGYGFVGSAVERMITVEENGSQMEWNGRGISWEYRNCHIFGRRRRIALSVVFRLRVSDGCSVAYAVKSAMKGRKYQPPASRTAGCVFRNPARDSAGRLLDAAGCKGLSVGGARVSEAHANFIENDGNCTARDILTLAGICRKRVMEAFGTELDFEVKTIGITGT